MFNKIVGNTLQEKYLGDMKNFVQASVILVYERLGLKQKAAETEETFSRKTHKEGNARIIKYLFQWDNLFKG